MARFIPRNPALTSDIFCRQLTDNGRNVGRRSNERPSQDASLRLERVEVFLLVEWLLVEEWIRSSPCAAASTFGGAPGHLLRAACGRDLRPPRGYGLPGFLEGPRLLDSGHRLSVLYNQAVAIFMAC